MIVYFICVAVFLTVTTVTGLIFLYLFFQKQFKYWSDKNVPHEKPSIPFGSLSGIKDNNMGVVFKNIYDRKAKFERYFGFWQFHRPTLMINDPDLIKNVLVGDFMNFHDHGVYANEKEDPLTGNLFGLEGTTWRNLRVKLTPTFTSGKMKMMFQILVGCGKELQEVLFEPARIGDEIDVKEFCARFSTDIISSAAFGVEAHSLKNPNSIIMEKGRKLFNPSYWLFIKNLIPYFNQDLAKMLNMRIMDKDLSDFFLNTFREVVDYREKNNVRRNDAMQLLIDLYKKGYVEDADSPKKGEEISKGDKFTFEQLAAQAFIFFVGGMETSSTLMQFVLYELAKNQKLQEKVREEIIRVLAKHNGKVTYEAIYEIELLGRVMDEGLRKYPPAPILLRICTHDYKIPDSDVTIEKDTYIIIPIMGIQMDEKYYPDPEKFDPDRFSEEGKASRPTYTYLPFGEGPRLCIGQRFGQMQTRVGLISLISKFKFGVSKSTPKSPIKYDPKTFVLAPTGGLKLKISLLGV